MADPRTGRPWRRLRLQILAARPFCEMRGPKCTGLATTVDHIVPLERGGALLDPSNLRPACLACNSRGGALLTNRRRARRVVPPSVRRRVRSDPPPPPGWEQSRPW